MSVFKTIPIIAIVEICEITSEINFKNEYENFDASSIDFSSFFCSVSTFYEQKCLSLYVVIIWGIHRPVWLFQCILSHDNSINDLRTENTDVGILHGIGPGIGLYITRMFEPRHNILSNVRTNVRKYVVTWLKHSRDSNRRYPDHF